MDVREGLAAGDTTNVLKAAKDAGVTAVGVLTGKPGREELFGQPHDHILAGVKDIPALLA